MKTKNENLIHVKLDYFEALESKRDILETEADLIKIAQAIQRYGKLRSQELLLKIALQKKMKEFEADVRKIKILLPKLKIPKIVKQYEEKIKIEKEKTEKKEKQIAKRKKPKRQPTEKKGKKKTVKIQSKKIESTLESQLKDIQSKLSQLG